mmetsp:Transcript_29140/g.43993  ORF Transcript_29140/g.43993 Transcript_29140/m.43993 type:complete len:336 (+) Transcript_29140:291-1298(+)
MHDHHQHQVAHQATAYAVCLAGQLRSLIFPVVQQRLNDTLLLPLRADAFLVASREWSRATNLPQPGGHLVAPWYEQQPPTRVEYADVERIRAVLPAIRDAVISNDSSILDAASKWFEPNDQVPVGGAIMDPRHRCNGNSSGAPLWRIELCHTRVVNAVRLRMCLSLIENAEAVRKQSYTHVLRTRPDIWLACVVTPRTVNALPSNHAAFAWDYLSLMTRPAASIALREVELSPRVPICSFPNSVEQCNPCVLRKFNVGLLKLRFGVDVARQCQLLSDEKRGRRCKGFSGPIHEPPLFKKLTCRPVHTRSYLFGSLTFPSRAKCDDSGGGGGGGGL